MDYNIKIPKNFIEIIKTFQTDIKKINYPKNRNKISLFKVIDKFTQFIPCLQDAGQLVEYLDKLPELSKSIGGINTYLEIGSYFGGTYIITTEFLRQFNPTIKSTAIDLDLFNSSYLLRQYDNIGMPGLSSILVMDTSTPIFANWIKNLNFDLVLIDGDHSYKGISNDYSIIRPRSKIVVLHDIINPSTPGVMQLWKDIKESSNYNYFEYTVNALKWTNQDLQTEVDLRKMGIGIEY